MKYLVSIIFFVLFSFGLMGQDTLSRYSDSIAGSTYLLKNVLREGEVLPEIEIKEVTISSNRSLTTKFQYWKYQRLINNLKRVYPYAVVVRQRIELVNRDLVNITSEKERKQYLNEVEKDVFASYEGDMREMTITQGRLLIKLIDRETSNTSYNLLKDYKGKVNAAFWQSIARICGTNLKEEYDPFGEDAVIEFLITEIDSGRL